MNNWIGLLIAATLAIVAGVLNWKYLERKTTEIEMVSFMAIADGANIDAGDTFKEHHFVSVDIPRKNSGYLKDSAVYFLDRDTVVGMRALRLYRTGDVVLRQELKTPPAELNLRPGEVGMWLPVGGSSFVPSLLSAGDMVSFIVPKPGALTRRSTARAKEPEVPVVDNDEPKEWNFNGEDEVQVITSGGTEVIGPFRLISVGPRLGTQNVAKASGVRGSNSNTLGIAVKTVGKGFEPNAEKLQDRILKSGFRQAGILLHRKEENKK